MSIQLLSQITALAGFLFNCHHEPVSGAYPKAITMP